MARSGGRKGRPFRVGQSFSASLETGESLLRAGQARRALAWLQRAIDLDPTSARAHYHLALAHLLLLKQDLEADWQWEEDHADNHTHYLASVAEFLLALGADPELESARDNLRLLESLTTWER